MGRKFIDLSGQKVGSLQVLHLDDRVSYKRWICKCDCGTTVSLTASQVKYGHCGCLNRGYVPLISKNKLYQLYIKEKHTQTGIEKITGISRRTIGKYIKIYGLDKEKSHISRDELYELYVKKEMNILDISQEIKAPRQMVSECIDKYDLKYERMMKNRSKKILKKRGRKPGLLIGRRFGKLTVESYSKEENNVLCRCDCGNVIEVTKNNLYSFNTTSCGCTKLSVGELRIEEYLKIHNVEYERQYTFEDCKHICKLRFDFAIFSNKELIGLIEFDGDQHDKPIEYFGGEETFKKTQKRDGIKDAYCKENNIPLIRIKYRSKGRIYEILNKEIKKLYK